MNSKEFIKAECKKQGIKPKDIANRFGLEASAAKMRLYNKNTSMTVTVLAQMCDLVGARLYIEAQNGEIVEIDS